MWSSYPYSNVSSNTQNLYTPQTYSAIENSSFLTSYVNSSGVSSFNSSNSSENYLNNYYTSSVSPSVQQTTPVEDLPNIKIEVSQYPGLVGNTELRSNSVCSDLGSDNENSINQATSTPTYQRYLPTNSYYNQNTYPYPYYNYPTQEQIYGHYLTNQFYNPTEYQQTYSNYNNIYNYKNESPKNQINIEKPIEKEIIVNPLKEQNQNKSPKIEQKPFAKIQTEKLYNQQNVTKSPNECIIKCNDIDFKYPTTVRSNPNIKLKLQDLDLWSKFNKIGTEMIITKSGRRMFPTIRVNVSGLNPNSKYIMFVDMVPVDDNRYKFQNGEWTVTGKCEPHFDGLAYMHPDSPMSGSNWMKETVSFHKLKLTNNQCDKNGLVN